MMLKQESRFITSKYSVENVCILLTLSRYRVIDALNKCNTGETRQLFHASEREIDGSTLFERRLFLARLPTLYLTIPITELKYVNRRSITCALLFKLTYVIFLSKSKCYSCLEGDVIHLTNITRASFP